MMKPLGWLSIPAISALVLLAVAIAWRPDGSRASVHASDRQALTNIDRKIEKDAQDMVERGRQTFRFDTFGDETFWGDTIKLHQAIEGERLGGVGPGLSLKAALALGLKVDVDALLPQTVANLKTGKVDLNSPAITLALIKANAVLGVSGQFDASGRLRSVGVQCALCHSTVDNALAHGIGHRLDGWANRDLNVGAITNLAPDLSVVATLLGKTEPEVRTIFAAWGPGKFDAELLLDGKGFRPDGKTAATLIPPAFGLAGVNLHTWTGWGSVPYWNAFVANIEMHGKGTFYAPRYTQVGLMFASPRNFRLHSVS